MNPFVIAAFENRSVAEAALDRLTRDGVPTRDVRIDAASDVTNAAAIEADEVATGGFFGNAARLLDDLFNDAPDDRRAVDYDDLAHRQAIVVTVQVDSSASAKRVADVLSAEGAKRVSALPQAGLET